MGVTCDVMIIITNNKLGLLKLYIQTPQPLEGCDKVNF